MWLNMSFNSVGNDNLLLLGIRMNKWQKKNYIYTNDKLYIFYISSNKEEKKLSVNY